VAGWLLVAGLGVAENVKGTATDSDKDGLIPLTSDEIRPLLVSLVLTAHDGNRHIPDWSRFAADAKTKPETPITATTRTP
jgi:hypothetical protein